MKHLNKINNLILFVTFLAFINIFAEENISSAICDQSTVKPIQDKATSLMKSRQYKEAVPLYRKLTLICPNEPVVYMQCGSALFASASQYFHRNKKPMFEKDAMPILEEALAYFKKAVSLYGNDQESSFKKSHAYYLMGDIYHYGLIDLNQAKKMYQESLSINSAESDIVLRELESIQKETIKDVTK